MFLKRHEEELSKASILGKIFAAASILPVFIFSDIFKLGYGSVLPLFSDVIPVLNIHLGIGLPVLGFSITGHLIKDMRVPNITRSVLYLWPKTYHGKRIGLVNDH